MASCNCPEFTDRLAKFNLTEFDWRVLKSLTVWKRHVSAGRERTVPKTSWKLHINARLRPVDKITCLFQCSLSSSNI